jgi:hypothetical protein
MGHSLIAFAERLQWRRLAKDGNHAAKRNGIRRGRRSDGCHYGKTGIGRRRTGLVIAKPGRRMVLR